MVTLFYSIAHFKSSHKWNPRLNCTTACYFPCPLDDSLYWWGCVFRWRLEIQSDVHCNDGKWVHVNKTHSKVLAWWLFPSTSIEGIIILLVHIHLHCVLSSLGTHIHTQPSYRAAQSPVGWNMCSRKELTTHFARFPGHICENIGLLWLLIYVTLKAKTDSVSILSYFPEIV